MGIKVIKTKAKVTIITLGGKLASLKTEPSLTRRNLKSRPGVVRIYVPANYVGQIFI